MVNWEELEHIRKGIEDEVSRLRMSISRREYAMIKRRCIFLKNQLDSIIIELGAVESGGGLKVLE